MHAPLGTLCYILIVSISQISQERERNGPKYHKGRRSVLIHIIFSRRSLNLLKVVLATTHSAGGHVLENMKFDVVIIDEATQALEAVCQIFSMCSSLLTPNAMVELLDTYLKGRQVDPSRGPSTTSTHRPFCGQETQEERGDKG